MLLLAAILAAEPTRHQHDLIPGADSDGARGQLCALCVAGPARITSPAPVLAVPTAITFVAAEIHPIAPSIDIVDPTASRAPPVV
ncbi:MAG: hypothetical protein ACXV7D_04860 [Thermoanaerobaculia bacterium]